MPCTDTTWLDNFIKECLIKGVNTCPNIASAWMNHHFIKYTDAKYQHYKQLVNRHMKSLEKCGIVRYTGRTVSMSDRSKIWELIQ